MRDTVPSISHGASNDLNQQFVAQDSKPATATAVSLESLSSFHRVLLLTDGTVTQLLQAHAGESVEVHPIEQQQRNLASADTWLQAEAGTPILERWALLQGAASTRPYCYAHTLIPLERLPVAVAAGLEAGTAGLGDLLRQQRLETFRELLWCGRAPLDPLFGSPPLPTLMRTYRIIAKGHPLALISESFPEAG